MPQRALIVVAHPDPRALTHAVARTIGGALERQGLAVTVADLAAEGFDPRYDTDDLAYYRGERRRPSATVRAEQQRIEEADALYLVFPMYWWSVPALLKGWLDRVFTRGWGFRPDAGTVRPAQTKSPRVRLVALAASTLDDLNRKGLTGILEQQVGSGIFGYCDYDDVELFVLDRADDPAAATGILQRAQAIAQPAEQRRRRH